MTQNLIRLAASAFAVLGSVCSTAFSAGLTAEESKGTLYGELAEDLKGSAKRGILQTRPMSGNKAYLAVRLKIRVEWEASDKQVAIPANEIAAIDEKKASSNPIGALNPDGTFTVYPPTFTLHKAPQGPGGGPYPFNPVFLVSKEARKFTIRVGALEVPIEIQGSDVKARLDPAEAAGFRVVKAELLSEFKPPKKLSPAQQAVAPRIVPAAGRLLAVTVEVSPKVATNEFTGTFVLGAGEMGLFFGEGGYVPAAGQLYGTELKENAGVNIPVGKAGKAESLTFYFAVPKDIKDFELAYLLAPVAKGSVSAPSAPAPTPKAGEGDDGARTPPPPPPPPDQPEGPPPAEP